MAERELGLLQLERDRIETAVDFYEAYAKLTLSEAEGRGPSGESSLWEDSIDAASALRQAAQWAMLIDPRRAASLMTQAGLLFQRRGYGFGTFLLVAAGRPLDRAVARRDAQSLAAVLTNAATDLPIDSPLRHPQQQAYLLLACAGMSVRALGGRERDLLVRAADRSPHRRGVVPVGALGAPISRYWRIAEALLSVDRGGDEPESRESRFLDRAAADVSNALEPLCRQYARSIEQAMVNERLWFGAAAPVDVGDIDIACIVLLAARRLGLGRTMDWTGRLTGALGESDALATVPVTLGVELAEALPPRLAADGGEWE